MKPTDNTPKNDKEQEKEFPGYPPYPAGEDIYNTGKKQEYSGPDVNNEKPVSENPDETMDEIDADLAGKTVDDAGEELNEDSFEEDHTGDDLDIPGADEDDEMEEIGSEDEENNYYSLGGDNHEDLEDSTLG